MATKMQLPKDSRIMQAWEAFKLTDEYLNALRWATQNEHTEGSLWVAFLTGYLSAKGFPPEGP